MTLVFNASPLIVLAKAGLLDTILSLGDPAIVPQAVADEVTGFDDPKDPARLWLQTRPVAVRLVPTPPVSSFLAAWDLGDGESAVISVADEMAGAIAVLDDMAARRCAQARGIEVTGTLGLVLLAKQQGLISEVTRPLEAITAAGLFVSPHHIAAIQAKAGE